jgi:hypothetical protein
MSYFRFNIDEGIEEKDMLFGGFEERMRVTSDLTADYMDGRPNRADRIRCAERLIHPLDDDADTETAQGTTGIPQTLPKPEPSVDDELEQFCTKVWRVYVSTGSLEYVSLATNLLRQKIGGGQETSETHYRLGQFLFAQGRHEESGHEFEISIEMDINNSATSCEDDICQTSSYCKNCASGMSIQGTRYRCMVCRDYDLCHQCHQNIYHMPSHGFWRIPNLGWQPKCGINCCLPMLTKDT